MEKTFDEFLSKMLETMIDDFNVKFNENKMSKEDFRPHLSNKNKNLGFLGEKTDLTDVNGIELCVGDAVVIYCNKRHSGEGFILKGEDKFFVAGMHVAEFENGAWETKIFDEKLAFKIAKIASYKDLKHNDTIGEINTIKAKLKFEE